MTAQDYAIDSFVGFDSLFGYDTISRPATVIGQLKVLTDIGHRIKPIKVWDGAELVKRPARVWNGSEWVLTKYNDQVSDGV